MSQLLENPLASVDPSEINILFNTPPADLNRSTIDRMCEIMRGTRGRKLEAAPAAVSGDGESAPAKPKRTPKPRATATLTAPPGGFIIPEGDMEI
jgi:hypothetical protein